MTVIRAIAWNTFLEAIRERVLYLFAGFAAFVFLATRVLAPLALGEGRRVAMDIGMMTLSISGLLIIIFVGHSLVYREIERGTVTFLFSRPVGRGEFVVGKFVGLGLVLLLAVFGMGVILALVLKGSGYAVGTSLVGALLCSLLELWVLAAVAILFAALCSPILAGLFVIGAWTIGNSAGALSDLADLLPSSGLHFLTTAGLWLLPRLDLYNGARWLVYGTGPLPGQWSFSVAYAGLYVTASLLLARLAFERRSLHG